ncbi:MAG: UDP-N-acetylmuramoyl-tripeptide--D-alanyl-D-alanine ligase [Elusimicrobiota bacterium]
MRLSISLKNLEKISGGKILKGGGKIYSFSTDTRKLKKGDVFWALKGASFDANEFIAQAVSMGIKGAICRKGAFPRDLLKEVDFVLEVPDTLKSLHILAARIMRESRLPVISVTGSNGKTTTKEMIRHILSQKAPVCSNFGNFNNHFGLPFSVLELEKKHRFAVFELGASRRGEVAELAKIIRPDVSVITTIGPEHLEFFKSMENIFKTETETLDYLKKGGIAVYHGDNPWLKRLSKRQIKKLTFGFEKGNDMVVSITGGKACFNFRGKSYQTRLKISGSHNLLNAAAAFLAATACSIKPQDIIRALETFPGVKMRMQRLTWRKSEIIFDAYNSNPQSLEMFLNETALLQPQVLVLGDMKELGKFSSKYHLEAGKNLASRKAEKIILIGPEMKPAFLFLKDKKENVKYFSGTSQATEEVKRLFARDKKYFFLFKASRSMKFESLLPDKISEKVTLTH